MFVQGTGRDSLLLFDEPATPLHPSAQRVLAKLLDSLSRSYQVIYTTHSPFMIDWNFPHRIRLFLRDHSSKRTSIVNKPYGPRERAHDVWDPLRESMGVTLGDVGILNKQNVLVEGISDQILLANASAALESRGRANLDLSQVSVIPYRDTRTLERLISMIKSRGLKVVVLGDNDEQGKVTERICRREQVPWIGIGQFCDRPPEGDTSIEDLFGIASYLAASNAFYGAFHWFSPIDATSVEREIGERSLGRYLTDLFDSTFTPENFSKTSVAISLARDFTSQGEETLARFHALIERIKNDLRV